MTRLILSSLTCILLGLGTTLAANEQNENKTKRVTLVVVEGSG